VAPGHRKPKAVKARRGAPGARFPEFQTGLLLLRSFIAKEKRITGIMRFSKRLLLIVAVLYNTGQLADYEENVSYEQDLTAINGYS
jgi:hypothetical protein